MSFEIVQKTSISPLIALSGLSGCGKTFGALKLARGLVGETGRVLVADTENSAVFYKNNETFTTGLIKPRVKPDGSAAYFWRDFLDAIAAAEKFDCFVIDSFSAFWESILDLKSDIDAGGGNSFANWKLPTTCYNKAFSALRTLNKPVICTFKLKTEYQIGLDERGKGTVREVGLAPIARSESVYNFDLWFNVGRDHKIESTKSRLQAFDGYNDVLTVETGERIAEEYKGLNQ